jgi:tRNA(Arg) A34 adenosine deaminase TadA
MQIAIDEANLATQHGEVPIGAVVVWNGDIIAKAFNRTEEYYDPTAHAEMLAIQQACEVLGAPRIPECDLYVTLEPCPMCATAISFARIRRLYYGAADPKGGGVFLYNQPTCHHKPEIYNGMAETECAKLLKEFFIEKR